MEQVQPDIQPPRDREAQKLDELRHKKAIIEKELGSLDWSPITDYFDEDDVAREKEKLEVELQRLTQMIFQLENPDLYV